MRDGGVVVTGRSDEHAGSRVAQATRDDGGVFERLPAKFQRQALSRIERHGLSWRYAKKARVELVHPVEKPGSALLGSQVGPFGRYFPYGIGTICE
nr:hypothetical protein [Kibdelosporangium sp. MJ126-NF4]